MKTVTLDVRTPADAMADFTQAWNTGKSEKSARRAGRDVKAVHGDVTALLNAGILTRTDKGRIVFPYDAVKVELLLHAA
jgi:predicted transcriptional regulator